MTSSPRRVEVSRTIFTAMLAVSSPSSGLGVEILMVEPTPPEGMSARPVLYTWTPATPSDARSPKSKDRVTPLCVGIWRPFKVTRLYSGPKPLTVTWLPSPRCLDIETPVILWSDSARLASGNLPNSSAEIASTTPIESRLMSIDRLRLPRMPVTTISSSSACSPCSSSARTGIALPEMAIAILLESRFRLNFMV